MGYTNTNYAILILAAERALDRRLTSGKKEEEISLMHEFRNQNKFLAKLINISS